LSGCLNWDFRELRCFTRIDGVIVNETPLRVGLGKEQGLGAPVDLSVYRVNGLPVVPGSSLKGALRHLAENLARSMGEEVHDPWDFEKVREEARSERFCIICQIFGSTELASHVRIYDARPIDGLKPGTFIKIGVAIDREFGGVRVGQFYSEEFVAPGTRWRFMMDVVNIKLYDETCNEDKRVKLLRSLISVMMDPGISVGARKTVGCGLIRLVNATWRLYELEDGVLKVAKSGVVPS